MTKAIVTNQNGFKEILKLTDFDIINIQKQWKRIIYILETNKK